jgi:undecaprenyl-diphosphatase
MDTVLWLQVVLLGVLEGLTEFIPVSSTGHLILLAHTMGFEGPPGRVFEIAIQLGAILAVVLLYARKLFGVLFALPRDPAARHFTVAILLAFLPAAIVGALAHSYIKSVLFSPWVVATSLIVGGIAILLIERARPVAIVHSVEALPLPRALAIGAVQCLAMIPGVSRSGATIMGALLMGVDRRTAAEFSFFLAIPTMIGATAYDLYKNRAFLDFDAGLVIAAGFLVAFLAALLVVRALVGFVARHGFAPFAWYRIALGTVALAALALG